MGVGSSRYQAELTRLGQESPLGVCAAERLNSGDLNHPHSHEFSSAEPCQNQDMGADGPKWLETPWTTATFFEALPLLSRHGRQIALIMELAGFDIAQKASYNAFNLGDL